MQNLDSNRLAQKLVSASNRLEYLVSHEAPHKLVIQIYEEMKLFGTNNVFDIYFRYLDGTACNQQNLDAAITSIILMDEIGDNYSRMLAPLYLVTDIFHGMSGVCEGLLSDISSPNGMHGDRFLVDAYTQALRMHSPVGVYPSYIWALADMAVNAWTTEIGEYQLEGKKIEDRLFTSVFEDYKITAIIDDDELTHWIIFLSQYNLDIEKVIKNLMELSDGELSYSSEDFTEIIRNFETPDDMEIYAYGNFAINFEKENLNKSVSALKAFKKIAGL